jgi:hypothetical protein
MLPEPLTPAIESNRPSGSLSEDDAFVQPLQDEQHHVDDPAEGLEAEVRERL